MKNRTVCFTGHRKIPQTDYEKISVRLRITLINLISEGYCYFGVGGALGFDTLAAKTVLDLKNEFPQIKLILILPCFAQTRGWLDNDIKMYQYIKRRADKVRYTSDTYFNGCMQKRNRYLVNNSRVCV
ncbi:MAG: SLOG family protein [Acutalibacteraceae bacterium]